jgi:hypothetical protein
MAGRAFGAARGAAAGAALGTLVDGAVQRMSQAGKGRGGNQKPNSDVQRIVKENDLNKAGQRALHDQITGQDFDLDDIRSIARELAKQPKYVNTPLIQ